MQECIIGVLHTLMGLVLSMNLQYPNFPPIPFQILPKNINSMSTLCTMPLTGLNPQGLAQNFFFYIQQAFLASCSGRVSVIKSSTQIHLVSFIY